MEEKLLKATGIVRRIDDLGRIVIPKEIRKTQRIKESDPIEIYINREGELMLRKYSPIGELGEFATDYAECLYQVTGVLACIADRDMRIAAAGPKKKEYEGKDLSEEIEGLMNERRSISTVGDESRISLISGDDTEYAGEAVSTILCNGDTVGAVIMCTEDSSKWNQETALKLVQVSAAFLGRILE